MKKILYLFLLVLLTNVAFGQNLTLIPLKIHLLTSDNNGKLENLKKELLFLNQAYNKANVGFYIYEVRIGVSKSIFMSGTDELNDATKAIFINQQGSNHSTNSINVYILENIGDSGAVGRSSFPFGINGNTINSTVSNAIFLNGNYLSFFNDRLQVIAHELGHYFGLWHTFHGTDKENISNPPTDGDWFNNDFITDTPIDFYGLSISSKTLTNNTYYKSNSPRNNIMSYWVTDDLASIATFDKVSKMENFTPIQLETISNYAQWRKNSATGKEYVLNASGQIASSPTISAEVSAIDFPTISNEQETYLINIGNIPQASYTLKSVIIERNLNNTGYYPIKMIDGTEVYDYITGRIETLSYRARFINSSVYSAEFTPFRLPATGIGDLSVSYDLVSPNPLIQNEYPNSFKVKVSNTTSTSWTGNLYLTLATSELDTDRGVGLVTMTNVTIPAFSSIFLDRGIQTKISSPEGKYYLKVYDQDGYIDYQPIWIKNPPPVNNPATISISPINTAFNFNNTNVGETTWQTFRVTNTSPTRVLTCDFGVTGNVFSSLAISSTFILNPNEYIDIPISFKPTSAQYYTGRFIVNGNFDNLTMSKTLTGTGITQLATISTDVPLGTDVTLIDTKVGEYREATLTLTNTSTTDFTGTYDLENTVFQGRVANQTSNTISVPAGQSRAIIIRFIPTDNGLTLGRLTIYGNATSTPVGFTIRATGYGAATGACVSVSTLRITSNVDVSWTGTREFGRFTLTNNSSSKIATVHRLQFSGNDASKFTLSPNITSTILNPNQSQEFIVYLTSTTPQGSYQGKVIIGVQDAGWDCAYYNIDLIGTAVQSVVNTPVLVYPVNNKIHTYPGGYHFFIAFDILKKNIGTSATYQLYLQDLTDNIVIYNHLNLGSFTGYGPDERCGWTSPNEPNEVTKLGHNYKWYIRAINATNLNDFKDSDVRYFSVAAPPVCKYPTISITDILPNSVTSTWQPVEAGLKYYLRLKTNVGVDISYPVYGGTELTKIINSLSPNTTYKVDMRTECSIFQRDIYTHSGFSPQVSFTTKPNVCNNTASIFPATTQQGCFGSSLQFSTNTVATSYQWYKDNLAINGATQVTYLALTAGTYKVKVVTSDGCEFYSNSVEFTYKTQVFAPSVSSTTVNAGQTTSIIATGCTGTVNWYSVSNGGISLATGSTLNTTLNITTTFFASCTSNSCTSSSRGSGTITVNTISCPIPTGMQWQNTFPTSFQPYWQGIAGNNYTVRYRISGTTNWTETGLIPCAQTGSVITTLSGLTNATTYEWQVKTICGASNSSSYSASTFSNTYCRSATVATPTGSNLTATTANIQWGNNPLNVNVRFRIVGTSLWFAINNIVSVQKWLTNLVPNSLYEVQVQTICSEGILSNFTNSINFNTLSCPPTLSLGLGYFSAGTYKVGQTISSRASVFTGTTYNAGNSITLLPGFNATNGTVFKAGIKVCN